jgi:hypothetical protein
VDNLLQGRRQEDENNIHYRREKKSGRDIIPKNNRWKNNLIFHKRFLLQMKGCIIHKILNLTHYTTNAREGVASGLAKNFWSSLP